MPSHAIVSETSIVPVLQLTSHIEHETNGFQERSKTNSPVAQTEHTQRKKQ